MSYDLFVQDLPPDAKRVEDIPTDCKPAVIGRRTDLIRRIKEVVPIVDFSDPAWGYVQGEGWSLEINMGATEDCSGFAFHARGDGTALGVVEAILSALSLRALDPQSGGLFAAPTGANESFLRWRAYRDQVVKRSPS